MMGSSSNMSTKVSMIVNVDKLLLQTKYIFQIPRDIQLSSLLISAFLMLLDTALAVSCQTYFAVIEFLPKISLKSS